MRVVLDACVLYPTVMREVLLAVAKQGLFVPIWSARLLEEWARAAARHGPEAEALARGDIARACAAFPEALRATPEGLTARLWLPDPADVHVLAVAIAASADAIITLNAKDFPRNILAEEGLERRDPDQLLMALLEAHPEEVRAAAEEVRREAERLSGQDWPIRALLKKARLPRLGKALSA